MDNAAQGRGRPLKEADLNYPRRKKTMEMIERMKEEANNVEGNKGLDNRTIQVGKEDAKAEQKPPPPTAEQAEDTEELDGDFQIPDTYHCDDCGYPLHYQEQVCDGCNATLDWRGL